MPAPADGTVAAVEAAGSEKIGQKHGMLRCGVLYKARRAEDCSNTLLAARHAVLCCAVLHEAQHGAAPAVTAMRQTAVCDQRTELGADWQ